MSIYDKIQQMQESKTNTIRLVVPKMKSVEDYNIITRELEKNKGIKEIEPFENNSRLTITYLPHIISIDNIAYQITRLGYRLGIKKRNIYGEEIKKKGG